MYSIIRPPRWCVHVAVCLEDGDDMILRKPIIRIYYRLTSASWIPCLRESGYELGWSLGFTLASSFGMTLGEPIGSPLGISTCTFIILTNGKLVGV